VPPVALVCVADSQHVQIAGMASLITGDVVYHPLRHLSRCPAVMTAGMEP